MFVNTSGYDLNKSKRFTAPNADNAATFAIYQQGGTTPVYSGNIVNNIGDFTDFNPTDTSVYTYTIQVTGSAGQGQSVPFAIAPNWLERVSYQLSAQFMVGARCWNGNSAQRSGTMAGCNTGVAFRDSHQFGFDFPTMWEQYASNPSAYERMSLGATYVYSDSTPAAGTPDFVKLLYWPIDVFMTPFNGGQANDPLLKEQMANFLYAYPDLKQYIPQSVYNQVRDYLFSVWGSTDKSRWNWYDIAIDGNLFQTYTTYDQSGKGAFPPGNSITPNLMMYEVAKREGRSDAQSYFDAAYNQTVWLINNLDWTNPTSTKGQRMSEHVTMENLVYFLKEYPTQAPPGLLAKINDWASVAISRSDNLWDFRKYSSTLWIIPGYNEPGNVAGFAASAFAASEVITDTTVKNRLHQIAMSQIDNVFGRNPTGRMYSHDGAPGSNSQAGNGFEGVELGWFNELSGGAGTLGSVLGVLDGSPKEASYPYNPYADPGYSEGWVQFNTAWNASLAYMAAEDTDVNAFNQSFSSPITNVVAGTTFGVSLKAPLNFDYNQVETGTLNIVTSGGDSLKVPVSETANSSYYFHGTVTTAPGSPNTTDNILQINPGETITVSYGYGTFKKQVQLTVGGGSTTLFSDNFESGSASNWTASSGTWAVVSDGTQVYKQTSESNEAVSTAGSISWTNYTVEGKVKLYDLPSTAASGLIARYSDSNNYYMLRLHQSGQLQLYKKVGGTFTQLGATTVSLSANTIYTLKLGLNGSSLTGYLNGSPLISASDSSLSAGKIGLRTYIQTASFDDITVTSN